ncbi:phosphoglycerate dehydrogenase [Pseudoalteromonas phenolica]|jgi:D-3-phosphoglycerate dehydrogenase|uniref:D-3-phosphoglycerate dehydrogenase n=1 Tax=Pseudoalteromonas phenolica TaxID=161398 RepID=A0A0S2K5B5_9GAMM|nr:phosphoglycerate dehydrogenase [Pseudoalteromonas phenolica]ALO43237.1 D-3-phosphoglycerate dehydrogenase [Pseudoalteromonas phenolica]MBE0355607.1 D-3-phosphoglycerate dehydrogenase [Pseudoalteromonas phenolica O-BC30]RXF05855.1 phosphoglycerate dehydrogenase [Pseudoalteromonas phenolica O-BC30]RZQ54138.1 phosphoglycerate dehydrogenase [Pseudoalteromonas phenolica]TMN92564.1 phosphoglycerate dehydrogenase [Pseudoalteromonas phenolica]|tara:strand:- start:347 stop:1576 length:1230 start_codon:yes stop_codon:yes gene_type:complete
MSKVSLAKEKIKILLLEGVHQSAVETLKRNGYSNIDYVKTSLPEDELIERISDVHFVGIRSRTHLNQRVIDAAEKLVAVGCFCIGTNQVDLQATKERGIAVFNAPFSNTRSVAELVLGEILLLLRGIPQRNAMAHRGEWFKSAIGSYEARGKTLGIIGYGHIGTQLGIMAENIGMKVEFYDIEDKLTLGNAQQIQNLTQLLQRADVVSLHVPETPSTKNLIGMAELEVMKQGAILINASRGTVVDIDALSESLRDKKLAGAAIDVFPVEPKSNDEEFVSPLREFDNVILTPHVGGSTQEAQENIGIEVAGKLAKYSDNGSTLSAVNFPEVSLPELANRSRLLHVHVNRPGVLTQINQAFAQHGINIAAQYLQTDDKIGYVVIDVDTDHSEVALKELSAVEGTIRARILH